jgi:hypothetical protein
MRGEIAFGQKDFRDDLKSLLAILPPYQKAHQASL